MTPLALRVVEVLAAVVPIAIVYMAGLIYMSEYLSAFGFSLHEVPLHVPLVLSHSYAVFRNWDFLILGTVLFLGTLIIRSAALCASNDLKEHCGMGGIKYTLIALSVLAVLHTIDRVAAREAQDRVTDVVSRRAATVYLPNDIDIADFIVPPRVARHFQRCQNRDWFRHVLSSPDATFAVCKGVDDYALLLVFSSADVRRASLREVAF